MGTKFAALKKLKQIEEGELERSLNEAIERESQFFIGHTRQYGIASTSKHKCTIQLTITIEPGDGRRVVHGREEAEDYLVTGKITTKRPGRPTRTTRAVHEQEQTGEDVLFVRASGGDDSNPRQLKLSTKDGRAIDPETGEAKPHPGSAAE
jgi:hypothetical protein